MAKLRGKPSPKALGTGSRKWRWNSKRRCWTSGKVRLYPDGAAGWTASYTTANLWSWTVSVYGKTPAAAYARLLRCLRRDLRREERLVVMARKAVRDLEGRR